MVTRGQLERLMGEDTSLPDWAFDGQLELEPECETCAAPLDTAGHCPLGCLGGGS